MNSLHQLQASQKSYQPFYQKMAGFPAWFLFSYLEGDFSEMPDSNITEINTGGCCHYI